MTVEILSWLIIFIFAVSAVHFIYQGILLPTIRLKIRFQLFALRDELRNEFIKNPFDKKVFVNLNDGINGVIERLHKVDFMSLVSMSQAFKQDPALEARSDENSKAVEMCGEKVVAIRDKAIGMVGLTFLANSAGGIAILFPIAIFIYACSKILRHPWWKAPIKWLVNANDNDRNRIIPQSPVFS